MSEPKPTSPGTFYGELSPQGQWLWNGTGQPTDDWIPNPDYSAPLATQSQMFSNPASTDADTAQIAAQKIVQNLASSDPNLQPHHGDSIVKSLKKINAILFGGGGGGGGGSYVAKTGDTMSGELVLANDQFAFDTGNATPHAAVLVSNAAGTEKAGIALGQYGDNITFVKANQTPANVRMGLGSILQIFCGGNDTITIDGTVNPAQISWSSAGYINHLLMTPTGDLVVTCSGGPNNGKSVNLTAGHWA